MGEAILMRTASEVGGKIYKGKVVSSDNSYTLTVPNIPFQPKHIAIATDYAWNSILLWVFASKEDGYVLAYGENSSATTIDYTAKTTVTFGEDYITINLDSSSSYPKFRGDDYYFMIW